MFGEFHNRLFQGEIVPRNAKCRFHDAPQRSVILNQRQHGVHPVENLLVHPVSPGPIDTGILDRSMPKEAAEQTKTQMSQENPMLRFGQSLEVAQAVAFLAFDATYTAGAEFPVDGGGSQI
ncbi:SDR family oxidoreductase [Cohnella massiliensis]|uniref:SDR family oxidoreductase n=1 Tax=Cohnella massiliensis TaxID=1816691 RepID=UPI001FEBFEEB|nr:SDR family oxidoreductase [Cohnella massiliensis]